MKAYIGPYVDDDRVIDVEVHDYDLWNADHTIGLIVLPILKRLREDEIHAVPDVDNEDLPEDLHEKSHEARDDFLIKRWQYILDQMIFSFESTVGNNIHWMDQFFKNYAFDSEDYKNYEKRIANGFKLFGKYFQALWQ
jgi:hypothetical protein